MFSNLLFRILAISVLSCPWLPWATPRMPPGPQQRDSQGRFIRDVQQLQPIEEQPPQTTPPQATPNRQTLIQRVAAAALTLLTTDVPASEYISNILAALQSSSSDHNTSSMSQPELASILDSPTLYVPPPRYVTNPPLPRPDFEAPGSNDSLPREPTPDPLELSDNLPPQQPSPDSTNERSSSEDEQPLPPHRPRLQIPIVPQQQPTLNQIPTTIMSHAPARNTAAMPSARSKLVPHFSGEIEHLI